MKKAGLKFGEQARKRTNKKQERVFSEEVIGIFKSEFENWFTYGSGFLNNTKKKSTIDSIEQRLRRVQINLIQHYYDTLDSESQTRALAILSGSYNGSLVK